MNALLIYPKIPSTFWNFEHALKFVRRKAAYPPLGLLTVASMLPQAWKKRLVDMNVRVLAERDIAWADIVFISAMIVQKDSVAEVIRRCKRLGKTIVAGGPYFSTQQKRSDGVDHYIPNEAEATLPRFLSDLEKGRPKKVYTSAERPDITVTPAPMWSLINFKDYVTMAIQYSRGCPHNCEFCDIVVMNGRVPRTKTTGQLIGELKGLYLSGWRGSVFIVDDNFIGNKIQAKLMLPHLISWQRRHGYPFVFTTEASVNLSQDEELMQLMSAANFSKVFLGIETPNISSLKECSKHQNTGLDLAKAVRVIHRHGMQVMGGFIVGFDSDTESIFEAQVRFIQKIGVVTAMVGVLSALPKTRLWHRLKAEKRLTGDPSGNIDGSLNFIPAMGSERLIAGYKEIICRIYTPKEYYRRIRVFIKSYRPTAKARLRGKEFNAFIRSLWRIGLFSRARHHYWMLLLRTSITNIRSVPIAVELAIIGLHFEKFSRQISRSAH